jgi:hypothetical protein
VQTTGLLPVQTPAWQVSVTVQAFPSSQAVPSGLAGLEQGPMAVLQVPASWHWSDGGQSAAVQQLVDGMQVPLQSLKFMLQFALHTPPVQVAVPFDGALQAMAQLPQWFGSDEVFVH